jgi:hypothetical protein
VLEVEPEDYGQAMRIAYHLAAVGCPEIEVRVVRWPEKVTQDEKFDYEGVWRMRG